MTFKALVMAFLVATIAVTGGTKEEMSSSDDHLRASLVDLQCCHVGCRDARYIDMAVLSRYYS